jgi:hypothetical protein
MKTEKLKGRKECKNRKLRHGKIRERKSERKTEGRDER